MKWFNINKCPPDSDADLSSGFEDTCKAFFLSGGSYMLWIKNNTKILLEVKMQQVTTK